MEYIGRYWNKVSGQFGRNEFFALVIYLVSKMTHDEVTPFSLVVGLNIVFPMIY